MHTPLPNKAGARKLAAEKNAALAPGLVPGHGGPGSPSPVIHSLLVDFPVKGCRREESAVWILYKIIGSGPPNRCKIFLLLSVYFWPEPMTSDAFNNNNNRTSGIVGQEIVPHFTEEKLGLGNMIKPWLF